MGYGRFKQKLSLPLPTSAQDVPNALIAQSAFPFLLAAERLPSDLVDGKVIAWTSAFAEQLFGSYSVGCWSANDGSATASWPRLSWSSAAMTAKHRWHRYKSRLCRPFRPPDSCHGQLAPAPRNGAAIEWSSVFSPERTSLQPPLARRCWRLALDGSSPTFTRPFIGSSPYCQAILVSKSSWRPSQLSVVRDAHGKGQLELRLTTQKGCPATFVIGGQDAGHIHGGANERVWIASFLPPLLINQSQRIPASKGSETWRQSIG
jgi:hypothetical protein